VWLASPAQAWSGFLDPTFGDDGKQVTDFGGGDRDGARAIVIAPDGTLLVAGQGVSVFGLARYLPDGTLDATFGSGGTVTTYMGTASEAKALALQDDGRIVVAGIATEHLAQRFGVVRYEADGRLDTTFGSRGRVITDFPGQSDIAAAVAIQTDGKIVVAGSTTGVSGDFAVARYEPDGSLDASFGDGGKVVTDLAGTSDSGWAVAIQADGRILVGGAAYSDLPGDFALVRYQTDGSLDQTFDLDGKVLTDFGGTADSAFAMVLQPDGRIVLGGASGETNDDFALARYNPDGSLDQTFSGDGKTVTDFYGGSDWIRGLALQPDGRIVAAGRLGSFALTRYDDRGRLEGTFGVAGKVVTGFGIGQANGYGVAVQEDGAIVVVGDTDNGSSQWDFALARYVGSGFDLPQCTILGTSGDDVLLGTAGPDVICGRAGDDEIYGLDGDDILLGDKGHDYLKADGGSDLLFGGADADTLDSRDLLGGNDASYGQSGTDSCVKDDGDLTRSCP